MSRSILYEDAVFESVAARVRALEPDTQPRWGTMDAAQMCSHCAEVLEVAAGKALEGTPFFVRVIGRLIKKLVISDRPYPQSTRTHPQYIRRSDLDFASEHQLLLEAMERFKVSGEPPVHPLFGRLTKEESGWAAFKHLDHHLRQFGL